MKGIVHNSAALKKRVKRFFDSPAAFDVSKFISHLSTVGEVLLFGGFIRDVALFSVRGFNSDIDVVVDCKKEELDYFFNFYDAKENKFGGYRLDVGGWSLDVWSLRDTWAFKEHLVALKDRTSLLETTITNWDAVAYSFLDEKLLMSPNYLAQLSSGVLDVVLVDNPNRLGAFLRVLRAIHDKRARYLMPGLLRYLRSEFSEFSVSDIYLSQLNFFNKLYFTASEIETLKSSLGWVQEDLFGMEIEVRGNNLSFSFS
ncbi:MULTISPECIES: nucleotidyltransferase domain-containing protein [Pseudomonas]|uniref:nucleotidyltransferase domain-containing protein n=1 Tax=Pseudomonas TaxID=286 RepID=UPI002DBEA3F1|nr:nucleotidyltransferase domain-containing protein [Pseudomonas asiatica]MEB6592041.1 nucleotidyltransferase domain-containing protein [Pseudomonas asiatica]